MKIFKRVLLLSSLVVSLTACTKSLVITESLEPTVPNHLLVALDVPPPIAVYDFMPLSNDAKVEYLIQYNITLLNLISEANRRFNALRLHLLPPGDKEVP